MQKINSYDAEERANFRKNWLQLQLQKRESEFTQLSNIRVLCATWNVNEKKPSEDLSGWLDVSQRPTFVAIGLQEMDLSAQGMIFGVNEAQSVYWETQLADTLRKQTDGTADGYTLVSAKQLGGVFLCVYALSSIVPILSDVKSGYAVTGILGIVANKGGVGVRFKLHDSTFCFLNAHFNAHQGNVETRNEDYATIVSSIAFYTQRTVPSPEVEIPTVGLSNIDNIFWVGDFNYRIDLPDEFVRQRIEKSDWETLLNADQMYVQIKKGNVFQGGWQEAPIDFAPTYKYNNNSTIYDTSEKRRIPAWTDRVLWRSAYATNLFYKRYECMSSDHRPVAAAFDVGCKMQNPKLTSATVTSIENQLEQSSISLPSASLSTSWINFGKTQYGVKYEKKIEMENDGLSIVSWRIIPKNMDSRLCKDWIQLPLSSGMLAPGEVVTIPFTCYVSRKTDTAELSNVGMDDIIVIHVQNEGGESKDYFISLSGKYLASSFATTLDALVHQPFPVRGDKAYPHLKLKVPKEIWELCDYIYKNGMTTHDIFIKQGKVSVKAQIREALDTGRPFPEDVDVYSVAETLLQFLNSMKEPLVTYELFLPALQVANNFTQAKQLLSRLPEVHYNVFFYLTAFFREVLLYEDQNKLTPDKLALVFAKVAFRTPASAKKVTEAEKMRRYKLRREFVLHFLIPANYNYARNNALNTNASSSTGGERASIDRSGDSGSFTVVNSNSSI